jgi:hypothetical protein
MTKHVRAIAHNALTPARQIWEAWCRFWFAPISPVTLGLYRILYGCCILIFVALLAPEIFTWFAADSMMRPASAEKFWGSTPHWSVLLWFPQRPAVAIFFAVFTVAALLLTIGLWTRFSALLVFLGLISIGHRNPLVLNGADVVLRVMGFYLVLAPAGAALSVDRLRAIARGEAGLKPDLVPAWTLRLMQLQISLIYASTVLLKLKGTIWPAGLAVYYTSRLEEFYRFPVPFLAHSMLLVNLATYWTLAVELGLAFAVWIPGLRTFALINGVLLHLGIEYSMNVPQFEYIMIVNLLLFCDVEAWWQWMRARWPLRTLARARLLVDGGCAACQREALLWLALEPCGRIEPRDIGPRAEAGLPVLVPPSGEPRAGVAAARWLAWRAPALWPLAPLLALPGVSGALRGPARAFLGLPAHSPGAADARVEQPACEAVAAH